MPYVYLKVDCRKDSLVAISLNAVCAHCCTHDVKMRIVNRILLFRCSGNDAKWLRVYYFMAPICRFADFTHANAAINARYAHT